MQGAPKMKKANLRRKNLRFGPKKTSKNGFFEISTQYCTKAFPNLTVVLQCCSNLKYNRSFGCVRYAINKNATLKRQNLHFRPKNFKKVVLWGFTHYCTKSLCSFTVVPRDAQIYTTVTHSPGKGAPKTKKATLDGKDYVSVKKTSKNWVSRTSQTLLHLLSSQFHCSVQ